MKKSYMIVLLIIFALIVSLSIFTSTKNITFIMAIEPLDLKKITSIEIIKSSPIEEKTITIKDQSQLKLILDAFSRTKLREKKGSFNSNESYWITLKASEDRKLGMTLYDKDSLSLFKYFNSAKYSSKSYSITNDFDLMVIKGLFK